MLLTPHPFTVEEDGGVVLLNAGALGSAVQSAYEVRSRAICMQLLTSRARFLFSPQAYMRASHGGGGASVAVGGSSPEVLLDRLQRLVRASGTNASGSLPPGYVLTPDNLLKMALIYLRIASRVPVVTMGETGCGKTSLVSALAACMGLRADEGRYRVLNFHAGTSADDVAAFVEGCERAAASATGWRGPVAVLAFLDEVRAGARARTRPVLARAADNASAGRRSTRATSSGSCPSSAAAPSCGAATSAATSRLWRPSTRTGCGRRLRSRGAGSAFGTAPPATPTRSPASSTA